MAKKQSKASKGLKTAGKKTGKQSGGAKAKVMRPGKGAGVKKAAAKPKAAVPAENPSKVSTGRGPSPGEIGKDLVALFNRGQFKEIENKYWSPQVVSVEGMGMAWHGRAAVEGKNEWWSSQNTIHGASAEGPYVGASGFAVKFRMDVEEKATGKRTEMDEVGVYTVLDGKIVREEFMYGGGMS